MRSFALAAFAFALPSAALACSTITDDAQRLDCYDARFGEIKLIRCIDRYGSADCEILTPGANDMVSCVAYDASNNPVAKSAAFGAAGLILDDIDASTIDHVDCEKVM